MLDGLYDRDLGFVYPAIVVLLAGAAAIGAALGSRRRETEVGESYFGTLAGAALGLLGLLLAFSFSLALARFDARSTMVTEEANAIGTAANYALMLPDQARGQVLALLRRYAAVRIALAASPDPRHLARDVRESLDIQDALWKQAVAVTAANPQSLPSYRFVAALNEMTNIHESRLTALRYHVPGAVMAVLVAVAMVATGFTGFYAGLTGRRRVVAMLLMSLTIAVVIDLVIDLDRPAQGLIRVPSQALLDAAAAIPGQ